MGSRGGRDSIPIFVDVVVVLVLVLVWVGEGIVHVLVVHVLFEIGNDALKRETPSAWREGYRYERDIIYHLLLLHVHVIFGHG